MANVPSLSNYTQTTVTAATGPSTTSVFDLDVQAPLLREIVAEGLIDEPRLQKSISSSKSFFTGNKLFKTDTINRNLKLGQQVRVDIEKDQNPFDLFQKETIEYTAVDTCHDQIDLDCTVPCINTLPTFNHIVFRFDTEYTFGVRACDKNTDFWDFNFFTKQYAKSRAAEQFGRELDLWNTVIHGLIAAPATTVDAKIAGTYPTHYWDALGSVTAAARSTVQDGYFYLVNNFEDITPHVFMAAEAAKEIIASEDTLAPYSVNFKTQRINTWEQWDLPGFQIADHVRQMLGLPEGVPTLIMQRSPWLTYAAAGGGLASQYPLWNANGTLQYIALLDPRVGYQVEKDGYHLVIKPYDCDKLTRGMIDTEYTGSGITFPQLGLILEFDAS